MRFHDFTITSHHHQKSKSIVSHPLFQLECILEGFQEFLGTIFGTLEHPATCLPTFCFSLLL